MTGASSLPPLKKNDGKYGLLALLFLLGAGALWFFMGDDEPEPPKEVVEAPAEPHTQHMSAVGANLVFALIFIRSRAITNSVSTWLTLEL